MATEVTHTHPHPHLPPAGTLAERRPPRSSFLEAFGRDYLYLLLGFPVALASFVVLITGLSLSVGLLVVWVGLPLMVVTLMAARLFALVERARLRARGDVLVPAVYRTPDPQRSFFGQMIDRLRDPQAWLDVGHGIASFPLAVVTWSMLIAWTSAAGGGLTYWIWERWVPEDEDTETLADVLDIGLGDSALYLIIGVFALVTLPFLVRFLALVRAGLAKAMLSNESVAQLQARVTELARSRAAAAAAEAGARERLERDIHDGPQQRLVRLGMDLATAERRVADDPETARRILAEARQQTAAALEELRNLSRGIAPPILVDRGLVAALEDAASRSAVPTTLHSELQPGERLPGAAEQAVYFTVVEALTNIAKHASAGSASVTLARNPVNDQHLVVTITDDGVGGADIAKGHGLRGLRDRLGALDATLEVDSPVGGPTVVRAEVPCGS